MDPDAAERRRHHAERRAKVGLYGDEDGTATLSGQNLPGVHAAAAMARVTALARAMKSAGAVMKPLARAIRMGRATQTHPVNPAALAALAKRAARMTRAIPAAAVMLVILAWPILMILFWPILTIGARLILVIAPGQTARAVPAPTGNAGRAIRHGLNCPYPAKSRPGLAHQAPERSPGYPAALPAPGCASSSPGGPWPASSPWQASSAALAPLPRKQHATSPRSRLPTAAPNGRSSSPTALGRPSPSPGFAALAPGHPASAISHLA